MATLDLTSSIKSRYGTSYGWNGWTTYNVNNNDYARFYLGQSSSLGNTRFQLQVTIPSDTVISSTQKLVVAWKADSAITPKYIRGFLSTTGFGANTDLWYASDILEVSNLYLDDSKGSRFTSYYATPPWGYFVFDDVNITAGTTYYISVASYGSDIGENTNSIGSNSGSGVWCRARNMSGYVSATLHYTSTYNIDVNMYREDEDKWYYSGDGINKFHADVGGKRVATSANDLGYAAAPGTSYSITPVPATGYHYTSTQGGSAISGTYPTSDFSVNLRFGKNYVVPMYKYNGGLVTKSPYYAHSDGYVYNSNTGNPWHHTYYYGNDGDPYNATSFGLVKPGYTFAQWKNQYSGTIFNQDTKYAATAYTGDGGQTVSTHHNFGSTLIAQWTPNNYTYTLDASGGTVSSTSVTAPYSNGTYALPTPTKTGYKFKGWYADIGANGPINLGLDYKFDGATGIAVQLDAYMDDWSTISTATLISCTNGGGWNLWFSNGVLLAEIYDSGIGGYQVINTGLHSNQLQPGWHRFKLVISNNTTLGCSILVDSSQCGGTVILSGGLNYNSAKNSTLWLGAEASGGLDVYDGYVFPGYIRHFSIENKYSGVTELSANTFATPCQNITLYADWEPCDTVYVKVDNRWRKGAITLKDNNAWMPPSNAANQPPDYVVHTPSGASYGFALNANGFYESTNKGISNSASVAQVDFYTDGTKKILVECINYGESNYDFGILSNIGASLTLTSAADTTNVKKSFKGSQSASIQTVDYGTVAAGNRSFYIKYRKDTSVDSNNDSLQFRIVFYY